MDIFGIGSALGGLFGAAGTAKAAKYNLQAQRETNAANLALAEQQNAWNIDQWNRENIYNSPVNKLGRLQAAGLNPLFYGLDGANTASHLESANLANQEAPQVDAAAIGNSFGTLASSLFNAAQIQLEKKNLSLKDKQLTILDNELAAKLPGYKASASKDTEAAKLITEQAKNEEKRGQLMDVEIDNARKEGIIKEEQAQVLQAQKDQIIKTTNYIQEQIQTEKTKQALNYALTGKANAETKKAVAETKTIDATRDDVIRKMAAEADVTENEARKIIEEIGLIMAQTDKTKADAEMARLQVKYTERYGDAEHVVKIFAVACQGIENLVDAGVKAAGAVATGGASGAAQSALEGAAKSNPVYKGQTKKYGWDASSNSPVNEYTNPWLD